MSQTLLTNNLFGQIIPLLSCERCLNTGLWLTPKHESAICPRIQLGELHVEPNQASLILRKACNRMFRQKHFIHGYEFELARILTNYNSKKPCSRERLCQFFFSDTNMTDKQQLRKFHELIENLRKVWLLPVGSRKSSPSGYWLIDNLADYKVWMSRAKSAPITQITTLHRNAKFNYPEFAEQLELEFWGDFEGEANENSKY